MALYTKKCRLFCKIFRTVSKVAGIISPAIGGLTDLVVGYLWPAEIYKGSSIPVSPQLNQWGENVLKPLIIDVYENINVNNTSQFTTESFRAKFDAQLKKLAALKIYYDAMASKPGAIGSSDYIEKAAAIQDFIDLLVATYQEGVKGIASQPFFFSEIPFNPKDTTQVGGVSLNWSGVHITGSKRPTLAKSGTIDIGGLPTGGGTTTTGGGSTTSKPGGGTTSPTKPTPGTNPTWGGGGTLTPTYPPEPTGNPGGGEVVIIDNKPVIVTADKPTGDYQTPPFNPGGGSPATQTGGGTLTPQQDTQGSPAPGNSEAPKSKINLLLTIGGLLVAGKALKLY